MAELYTLNVEGQGLSFSKRAEEIPNFVAAPAFDPSKAPKGLSLVCRMGAVDLAHCVIFRYEGKPGGIFAMHEQGELLFAAVAETNLAYALAKGLFGEITTNARLGVDIYEAAEDEND